MSTGTSTGTTASGAVAGTQLQLCCSSMISEVKAQMGRSTDTGVVTDTRMLRWLNDAQEDIAEQCYGLEPLETRNISSIDFTQTKSYALYDFTSPLDDVTTDNRVCHLRKVFYVDGNESKEITFYPTNEFDEIAIDPTHSDYAASFPTRWTRRGANIEILPLCATTYLDNTPSIGIVGDVYPIDFTDTDSTHVSVLDKADDVLMKYAEWKAWGAVGGKEGLANSLVAKMEYGQLFQDYRDKNNILHEAEPNIYGPYV